MFANLLAVTSGYCSELANRFGTGWNRFWFAPTDPSVTCLLRIGLGLGAVSYFLSHSIDLQVWFGPAGLLPSATVQQLEQSFLENARGYHWSHLNFVQDTGVLWVAHLVAVLVSLALALGFYTRASSVITSVAVLSYVHRAPM